VCNVYRVEDIDEMDAGLSELQMVLKAGGHSDMLLQQNLLQDAADGELFTPAEIKLNTADSETVELMKQLAAADAASPMMKPLGLQVDTGASLSLMQRIMKYTARLLKKVAVPLPLLLVMVLGGLYLLCDGWHEMLNDLGLLISPQLKHVRGAPPT